MKFGTQIELKKNIGFIKSRYDQQERSSNKTLHCRQFRNISIILINNLARHSELENDSKNTSCISCSSSDDEDKEVFIINHSSSISIILSCLMKLSSISFTCLQHFCLWRGKHTIVRCAFSYDSPYSSTYQKPL